MDQPQLTVIGPGVSLCSLHPGLVGGKVAVGSHQQFEIRKERQEIARLRFGGHHPRRGMAP